jgi:hypothetical protein
MSAAPVVKKLLSKPIAKETKPVAGNKSQSRGKKP